MAGLNLGEEIYEDRDSVQYMKVHKMEPPFSKKSVRPGTFVNVWYRSSRSFNFDKEKNNAAKEDSLANALEQQAILDSIAISNDTLNTSDIEENYEDEF